MREVHDTMATLADASDKRMSRHTWKRRRSMSSAIGLSIIRPEVVRRETHHAPITR